MTGGTAPGGGAGAWLFQAGGYRPLTAELLTAAGLDWQPLAGVRLTLARPGRAGAWHLAPGTAAAPQAGQQERTRSAGNLAVPEPGSAPDGRTAPQAGRQERTRSAGDLATGEAASAPAGALPSVPAGGCARIRRAAARGQVLRTREAGLLDSAGLCARCAARLTLPGPHGAYLSLARHLLAARDWVTALEHAAPAADWLACTRWTARTPFTDPNPAAALIAALPAGPPWAGCAAAARTAWDQLRRRAQAAHDRARHAAGPPG